MNRIKKFREKQKLLKSKPFISDKIKKFVEILQNNIENNIPQNEKKTENEYSAKNNDTLFNIINSKKNIEIKKKNPKKLYSMNKMEENDLKKIKEYLDSPEMRRQLKIYEVDHRDKSCPDSFAYIIITIIILIIIIFLIVYS